MDGVIATTHLPVVVRRIRHVALPVAMVHDPLAFLAARAGLVNVALIEYVVWGAASNVATVG